MRYLFCQINGNSTTLVNVEEPQVNAGTVYATKVGQFAGWNDDGENLYEACSPVKFIAGEGTWTMT